MLNSAKKITLLALCCIPRSTRKLVRRHWLRLVRPTEVLQSGRDIDPASSLRHNALLPEVSLLRRGDRTRRIFNRASPRCDLLSLRNRVQYMPDSELAESDFFRNAKPELVNASPWGMRSTVHSAVAAQALAHSGRVGRSIAPHKTVHMSGASARRRSDRQTLDRKM